MSEQKFDKTKKLVLEHIQSLFDEMEEEMAMSHREKYALLEDSFDNASDEDELRVAFERWYHDHSEDLRLDYGVDELWDHALGGEADFDSADYGEDNDLGDDYEDDSDEREEY